MTAPSSEMIPQLEAARQLVLGDAHIYTQILPGILPIIGPGAPLEVRRWGAEFFAESFASPSLGNDQKEELGVQVLPVLQKMLEIPGEDAAVVKAVVQTVASLYPLVFKRTYVHIVFACFRESQQGNMRKCLLLVSLVIVVPNKCRFQHLTTRRSYNVADNDRYQVKHLKAYGHCTYWR